ncbi:uncharacterized protein LOC113215394 [Frankliniella occidentalis]|uniref:Protein transport protein sec16 n=1 Tax=Frankliniella occidentalis TaxID=133901 RepID=A0A9C6X7N8_FRAOC|nr:uncharacterized protein LOC113215394 [Frankliniella occidentalis]
MSDPYWVKTGGLGAPYYSMAPPAHQQTHQMSQQQVPPQQQLHNQQLPPQQPQHHQQYQNMSWNSNTPKASVDSWGSWHNQPQAPPSTNNAAQNYTSYDYSHQPVHPTQSQANDTWNWGVEDTSPAPVQQQPSLNNNLDQSFQNDTSWNWSVDQTTSPQNAANYYQMGYGGQHGYVDQNQTSENHLPVNENLRYSDGNIEQTIQHDLSNVGQFTKLEEEFKTEPPVGISERYEDQLEPAMSETSKNSMTPQWSIESQVSQDSDDISSSLGHTGGISPTSTSQAKSEDSAQRGFGSASDAQNLWEDTEDDEDAIEKNSLLDHMQDSNTAQVDSHSNLNLDETISALENLNVTLETSQTSNAPARESSLPPYSNVLGSTSDSSLGSSLPGSQFSNMSPIGGPLSTHPTGPPAGMPPSSGGPPSGIPPSSGGPPSGIPPSSMAPPTLVASVGGNPYSVNRSGLNHKSANKLFPNATMSRQLFAPPLQSGNVIENNKSNSETLANSNLMDNQLGPVENRSQEPPAGQETGGSTIPSSQTPPLWQAQENHDIAPRFGLDRNQYLETGQLTSQTSEEENAPPPGLHRLVTGQLTEQDSQLEVSTPPPGLDRMVPGQVTEREGLRMVPGRMEDDDDDDDDDDIDSNLRGSSRNASRVPSRDQNTEHAPNLRRMIPGQTDSQEEDEELPNISIGPGDLPPGLHRMVPGESSSPESLANPTGAAQNSQIISAFQPIEPCEQRVVTGVSMESMPLPVSAPAQQAIKLEPVSSSPEHVHSSRNPGSAQPPSERSETIGSDGVDDKTADNTTKKSDRRARDDVDSEGRDRDRDRERDDRDPRGRDYYRRDREDERERSLSPSDSGSNRYRDDRDRDRERDRDRRYDSPEGPSRYRADRDRTTREKDVEYDSERRYRSSKRDGQVDKSRRGYNREEDEADSDEYGSERENRKWNRDRDVDRDLDRDRNRDADRDRDRDRDRFRERDRYREGYRDRDRDRERDRDRDRGDRSYGDDYYRRGERRVRDDPDKSRRSGGRRSDDFHGYDDEYYRDRRSSRPSSRSGSVHEYSHAYERDYRENRHDRSSDRHAKHSQHNYPGGYYYNPQEYYRYQMYYANLRKTDPEAYAAWYRKYYSQYAASQPGTYEDRGSLHSGRSSANEELNNQRFDRHRSPNRSQTYHLKSPQTSSSNRYQSTDNPSPFSRESGRGVGHGESSLDETNSSIQRLTPFKFSTAHIKGILTRRGQLLKVLPHYPLDGQSASIEVHSLQSLIPQDASLQELLALPGPLVRGVTHKKTIILYLRSKMEATRTDPSVYDRQSVILLYELLILLLKQNGMIVGTDIAELLLRNGESSDADDSWSASGGPDPRAQSTPSPAPSGGSRTSSASATPAAQFMNVSISQQSKLSESEITNKFREFLLYGNTKEALEWAMKHGLWGHALFLSSKLDQRMYHSVMTRFANGLALTDPIQTLYQLLSGWQPAAVTCVADDKWGDWRPHLAMILSNTSSRPEIDHKAIMTLGDTLSTRGCLHAAHFCYLMAQHPFGTFSQRSSKYVLLGSSHLRPFTEFASTEAIMITSIYEYARSLADPSFHVPNLQPYKYLMATRLVEANMLPEAVHYCEVMSRLVVQNPHQYDSGFIHDIAELGERLKFHDPYYSTGGDLSAQGNPDWLLQISSISNEGNVEVSHSNIANYNESFTSASSGMIQSDSVHDQTLTSSHSMGNFSYNQEPAHEQMSTEQQQEQYSLDQMQQSIPQTEQIQQQQMSYYYAEQHTWSAQGGEQPQAVDPSSYSADGYGPVETDQSGWWSGQQEEMPSVNTESHAPVMSSQNNLEPMQQPPIQPVKPTPSVPALQPSSPKSTPASTAAVAAKTANRQPANPSSTQSNSSWFGGLWNKLALRPKNQMKLPDDKNPSIVWDDQKKRWMNTDADGEDESANVAPPPKMSEMPGRFSSPGPVSSIPGSTPVANGSANVPFNSPVSSIIPSSAQNEGDSVASKPPAGSNMFKLPRGRSLRASYVDVMNPGGVKAPVPSSMPPPNVFPSSGSQPSSLNYFVPAAVEGIENAPTDFLTPAPTGSAESAPEQQPLSRWSSTSSLSREVQSYTSRRPPSRNQVQTGPAGPQMFNPAQFSQPTLTSHSARKRYAN